MFLFFKKRKVLDLIKNNFLQKIGKRKDLRHEDNNKKRES
jgi:hypothetical protein